MEEIWRNIPGTDGELHASNYGRIKRISTGRILKPRNSRGYSSYCAKLQGKYKYIAGHVAVLEAFVCLRPKGMDACHWDGVRSNNRLDNLRWDTRKGNFADMVRHGTSPRGANHAQSRLTNEDVLEMRRLVSEGARQIDVASKFRVTKQHVHNIVRGKNWRHI